MRTEFEDLPASVRGLTVLSTSDMETFSAIGRKRQLSHVLASYSHEASPLEILKDYILKRYQADFSYKNAFTTAHYETVHKAVVSDFLRADPNISQRPRKT
jgi:hypothetical protein